MPDEKPVGAAPNLERVGAGGNVGVNGKGGVPVLEVRGQGAVSGGETGVGRGGESVGPVGGVVQIGAVGRLEYRVGVPV